MKIIKIAFGIILIITIYQVQLFANNGSDELKNLYENKKFFELNDAIKGNNLDSLPDILFYKGAVSNKFNHLNESINYLNQYLSANANSKEAKLSKDCYELLADNYTKLYQYQKAAETYQLIFDNFKTVLDSEEVADVKNSIRLWKTFAHVPPQSVVQTKDTKLKIIRDKARLANIPLLVDKDSVSFIFDTGANLSTISRSFATKLGFKIFEDSIEVGTITGNNVYASLGTAPLIRIGNAVIENSVFLVFNDSDLAVPQINYQANGIIGFPIIEGFKEVTITQDDSITFSKRPKSFNIQNMCLDHLTPIVKIEYQNKPLSFCFDTGARTSSLFMPFYKEYESFIKANYSVKNTEIAGAGSSKKFSVYEMKDFDFLIGGKKTSLQNISILTEPLHDDSKYFHGNLGQDVIKQFSKMTINFESMSLIFE